MKISQIFALVAIAIIRGVSVNGSPISETAATEAENRWGSGYSHRYNHKRESAAPAGEGYGRYRGNGYEDFKHGAATAAGAERYGDHGGSEVSGEGDSKRRGTITATASAGRYVTYNNYGQALSLPPQNVRGDTANVGTPQHPAQNIGVVMGDVVHTKMLQPQMESPRVVMSIVQG